MTKNYLLAAAAVTALLAAGSAQAGTLSARTGTAGVGTLVNATTPYRLAQELNFGPGAGVAAPVGQFDTIFTFNQPLGPGSYTVTIAYEGAVITSPLPTTVASNNSAVAAGADRTAAFGFEQATGTATSINTLTVTQQTATSITFSLFVDGTNPGNVVNAIYVSPAILVSNNVRITAASGNQITGAVIDQAVIATLITTGNRGFAAAIDGGIATASTATGLGNGAGVDTRVLEGGASPFFTTIGADNLIGEAIVAVSGNPVFNAITGVTSSGIVYRDLAGTAVSLSDVVQTTVGIRGLLSGFTVTSAPASTVTTTATSSAVVVPGAGTANTAGNVGPDAVAGFPVGQVGTTAVSIAPTSTGTGSPQLAPTAFDGTVQLQLGTAFTQPAVVNGSFENLQTDGFSYIIPWVASQTLSGTSGNQSVIRISNIASDASTAGGRVYAQVYNASNAPAIVPAATPGGSSGTPVANSTLSAGRSVFVGTLGSSGELILSSASLQNVLGDFGRADIRLTIATTATTGNTLPGGTVNPFPAAAASVTSLGASTIVVKRLIATANGGLTEVEVLAGDASSTANAPVNQGVQY